ncbi:sensor histidine kinase [Streptomyces heilongjiangensis]|uniref:histidine kinase n=1 Tax=Streptomyces heilongjiangensis TaxID=945052 RepID=A0ABW1AZC2_9ACTN|nr:sensor histidine kinase [Streptomyces heilongjiangensis]MDC2951434.1 sensor domain-containing protein [Streptomyces heilongjiangensis]
MPPLPPPPGPRARRTLDALEHLVGGLGTALLALISLAWLTVTMVTSVFGVGLILVPTALEALHSVADRERVRLSRWGGTEILAPEHRPDRLRTALADQATRREFYWLACHATLGLLLGAIGAALPLNAVRDGTFPLWWQAVPPEAATSALDFPHVHDLPGALVVGLMGVGWLMCCLCLTPAMARLQAWPGRRLLAPDPDTDLALRVAQLTATRAAALDAHATELRRIERALHDGTQNRVVAVTVLLGAARRALGRDDAAQADAVLERAQSAAEQALAELRAVVRSILPPVLADHNLGDALSALVAASSVPCRLDTDAASATPCAKSVEATAYFVAAEALTNIARHSGASQAAVTVRRHDGRLHLTVTDDGHGGADIRAGSGLSGIHRRVAAHDGTLELTSPPGGPTTLKASLPCGS